MHDLITYSAAWFLGKYFKIGDSHSQVAQLGTAAQATVINYGDLCYLQLTVQCLEVYLCVDGETICTQMESIKSIFSNCPVA